MVEAGASRDEIVAQLVRMREKVHLIFVLETLEYLQRGGRIGKAQALMGTLLKFKPLLAIDDGEVVPVTRVRSRAKALETLQETLLQRVPQRGAQVRLGLTQAVAPDEAKAVGDKLAASFGTTPGFIAALGPVIGVHVGPGTIGAAVYARGMKIDGGRPLHRGFSSATGPPQSCASFRLSGCFFVCAV